MARYCWRGMVARAERQAGGGRGLLASASPSEGPVDEGSVAGLRAGDNDAWSAVVYELAGPLRAFISVRGANDVDGTLGDVFLDMSRNIGSFEGSWADLRSWAFTIARRRVIDDHRYFQRRPSETVDPFSMGRISSPAGNNEADAMGSLGTDRLLELINQLTPTQRDVIFLRFFLALTAPEVATVTGSTVTAVRANQRRAIRKLQRLINDGDHSIDELLLDVTG